MKSRYLPYEKAYDSESARWCLVGRDANGAEFGVGAGPTIETAEERLRAWLLDSLLAAAGDAQDRLGDLVQAEPDGPALTFSPLEVIPIRLRVLRSRNHMSQSEVAARLGLSQQAYAKLEKPGANLQLRTIQQVEAALNEDLLQLA